MWSVDKFGNNLSGWGVIEAIKQSSIMEYLFSSADDDETEQYTPVERQWSNDPP